MITAWLALTLLAAPAPGTDRPSPVASDLDGDRRPDRGRVEMRGLEAWVVVETAAGSKAERYLGDKEIPFQLEGRSSRLALRDVTGDGRSEVVVAATTAGRGLLYVLRLDGTELAPLTADADAFVSETGSFPDALSIDTLGRVTVASLEYSEESGPREALFTYEWNAGAKHYRLAATDLAQDD